MIQDIFPSKFFNEYKKVQPDENSCMIIYKQGKLLAAYDEKKDTIVFPKVKGFGEVKELIYMFSIDSTSYFWPLDYEMSKELEEQLLKEGYSFYTTRELRDFNTKNNSGIFAVFCGYHLCKWYNSSRFCGACGEKTIHDEKERAMLCPSCGNMIFPRINPAVIIGVVDGDKIILTRYRKGYRHNALVAGFVEFGETLEETVAREVMEEVGLKVKNIKYYKSQPWGEASDILAGFYCQVDGDTTISMDENELGYAQWVERQDIVLQPNEYSLTNEMMKAFKEGYKPFE